MGRIARGGEVMSDPTAAALVQELAQHMSVLLDDPAPLVAAPAFFLEYWLMLLDRIKRLLSEE
jgi:hypothetical protein